MNAQDMHSTAHLLTCLRNSSTRMTGKESQMTATHSEALSGATEKTVARGGTYRMQQCSSIDSTMAPSSHRLLQGGSCTRGQARNLSNSLVGVSTGVHLVLHRV